MKYLILLLFLSGCAHISDYNKGCRDGIVYFLAEKKIGIDTNLVNKGCNNLDKFHNEGKVK